MTNIPDRQEDRGVSPVPADPPASELKQAHAEAIVSAAVESHSGATRRAYAAAWRQFVEWCDAEGYTPYPADPQIVAAYLTQRADAGRSFPTLKVDRAGIRRYHEDRGVDSPTTSPGIAKIMRGLARRAAAAKLVRGQATGLTAKHLAAIVATAHQRRTFIGGARESEKAAKRRGDVDVALISVMRDALLRRSEAIALTWADVDFKDDGTALITIRRSKTDQEGEGAVQFVGTDAAAALMDIRPDKQDEAAISGRSVFGLKTGESVSRRITAAARAAGLKGDFKGHSPRVGMAQDLAEAGASTVDLMIAGRWKAARMPAHYARAQSARNGAVARFYRSR
ncbi:MAG: tyrosine-type recombinase/integrase [Gemmatimonadetes bacterium]|nr:tyrosine-type recombinase/integrase [Gemmatimonadota bacterium]MYE94062.1 tyrosine-type recombinase/integrase [Gemmatimonadota bacterium]MYJ12161.1 tyrosine-type recombinase/integrase [Gemmatimonadota bacterium]